MASRNKSIAKTSVSYPKACSCFSLYLYQYRTSLKSFLFWISKSYLPCCWISNLDMIHLTYILSISILMLLTLFLQKRALLPKYHTIGDTINSTAKEIKKNCRDLYAMMPSVMSNVRTLTILSRKMPISISDRTITHFCMIDIILPVPNFST